MYHFYFPRVDSCKLLRVQSNDILERLVTRQSYIGLQLSTEGYTLIQAGISKLTAIVSEK
jgi:hypothetical protein